MGRGWADRCPAVLADLPLLVATATEADGSGLAGLALLVAIQVALVAALVRADRGQRRDRHHSS